MYIMHLFCRCSLEYKIVPEHKYEEDCKVDVEHICEDYLHIPVKPPAYGHQHHEPHPPEPQHHVPHEGHHPPHGDYQVPHAPPIGADDQEISLLAVNLFSRNKREAQEITTITLKEMVKGMIMSEMQKMVTSPPDMQQLIPQPIMPLQPQPPPVPPGQEPKLDIKDMKVSNMPSESLGGFLPDDDLKLLESEIMAEIQRRKEQSVKFNSSLGAQLVQNPSLVLAPSVVVGVPLPVHVKPPAPHITIEELPSEPGCRTIARKTCYKTPIIINKKVGGVEQIIFHNNFCHKLPLIVGIFMGSLHKFGIATLSLLYYSQDTCKLCELCYKQCDTHK